MIANHGCVGGGACLALPLTMTAASPLSRPQRWRHRLFVALLLPLALLLVVVEDVLWRGARALLRRAARWRPLVALQHQLGRLSGWAALPLFLVPEVTARVGEVWVAVLVAHGRIGTAVLVYAVVRLLATLIAVFIWQACAPALLRLPWFARIAAWIGRVRDWAWRHTEAPRRLLRRLAQGSHGLPHRLRLVRQIVLRPRRSAPRP